MQIPSFLWMVLYLIAVTSSKSVRSTYNATREHGSPLKSLQEDEVCNCGENSSSCKYENGKKVCTCLTDYAQKDGKCEICVCGADSSSCKYRNGKKVCKCLSGYAQKDGKCELCDCGEYSLPPSCKFENGDKVCFCFIGYAQKDGKCEICECGENTWSCKYENEEKVCLCRNGYQVINGKCEKISISSTVPPTVTTTVGPTGEKIDAYLVTLVAVSVFSSIVLMFVACVMCQRYCVTRTS